MHYLFRVTLLCGCLAMGVACAVGLALSLEGDSAEPEFAAAPKERGDALVETSANEPSSGAQPAESAPRQEHLPTLDLSRPLATAPYSEPVGNQVESLERQIQQAQEMRNHNIGVVNDALQILQQPTVPTPGSNGNHPAPSGSAAAPEAIGPGRPYVDPNASRANVRRDAGENSLSINIRDADIREVLDLISEHGGLNILASNNVHGRVSATLAGVDIDMALEAILRSSGFVARREKNFVFVGTPDDFIGMEQRLDRVATRVYKPNYVTAKEVQAIIGPMLTPQTGSMSISTAAATGIGPNDNDAGGNAYAGSEVLLVRDYEMVLLQIDQIVEEVDRQPFQVAIEAMILSVHLKDENSMGVNFELLRNEANARLISGAPLNVLPPIVPANEGLKFGFLDSSMSVFLNALETVGDTNVIASPRLMCLNKQRAEILIGEQLGYISTTVTETASTQSVEFLEVGTQLRLRPYISNDGMIRLEVHPELSTGSVETEEGFTLPKKQVTQVTTNIMCRDGATVIIGGLIREQLNTETKQIPLLGSLPGVGVAFRQKKETIDRRELIVLITPHIVYEPQLTCDGERAACEFNQRQTIYNDKMSPIGRRQIATRYFRLARAAWAAGEARKALRYANLAVHFDPQDRIAINLRAEIIANSGVGDTTVDTHLKEGLAPWQHPVGAPRLRNWVLENGETSFDHPPALPYNYDPGAMIPPREIIKPGEFRPIERVEEYGERPYP